MILMNQAGWYYSDMNPGNVMYCSTTNKITVVDLGVTGKITPSTDLNRKYLAIQNNLNKWGCWSRLGTNKGFKHLLNASGRINSFNPDIARKIMATDTYYSQFIDGHVYKVGDEAR